MRASRNPLAPGVYWIDVTRPLFSVPFNAGRVDQDEIFQKWVTTSAGAVRVLSSEGSDTVQPGAVFSVFHTFEVVDVPSPFPFAALGFPTVVKLASSPGGVTKTDRTASKADVFQKPKPLGLGEFLEDLEHELAPTFERFGTLIVLGIGLYLWANSGKGKNHAVY